MLWGNNRCACPSCTRRGFLRTGVGAAALGAAAAWPPGAERAAAAGATDDAEPYPIPWLDTILHHNQVPRPGGGPTELSHIYHFKGQVGRAVIARGAGRTNRGEPLLIGAGTDYSYIQGEYVTASGAQALGTFSHL
jgi:hypothetical protein